ncbi:MAG: hypothetical protein IJE89_00400 [Bacilli bacterium]|nr:hypothetical protein [Bacilli bacterium]
MKNTRSLVVSISSVKDIDKIKENTKYINIDITNPDHDVIDYFLKNGENYLYSEIVEETKGYIYVSHQEFFEAESIISSIYANMPNNLNKLEMSRYLYTQVAKYVFFDINIIPEKNETYSFSLTSKINNLWSSLSSGRITSTSIAKLYYYLCRRLDINITILSDSESKESYNKLTIDNLILNVNLFKDIPYIQTGMETKCFTPYNNDLELDKKIKYTKNKYTDSGIDLALKNIDYTKENCIEDILSKTEKLIKIDNIKSVELSIIYRYIFSKYCPNYNIKINNLYLNNKEKSHFIMLSYNNMHYSYNYKKKSFIKVDDNDILENIKIGKIGLYLNEFIPNIKINLNV